MKIKTLVIALALTAAPVSAFAAGCNHSKEQAMSCAAGSAYDSATQSCLPVTT